MTILDADGNSVVQLEEKLQKKIDDTKFKKPEDALFDLPKYLIENKSKHRSEESLSEQMLSGIPEVDLGISERIRNIEDTEKVKSSNFNYFYGHKRKMLTGKNKS